MCPAVRLGPLRGSTLGGYSLPETAKARPATMAERAFGMRD